MLLFFLIHLTCQSYAQVSKEKYFSQQVAFYKNELLKSGFTFLKEDKLWMNNKEGSGFDIQLKSGNSYVVLAFVNCEFCKIKMHFWNTSTSKKTQLYPKTIRNNGMSAASYKFDQKHNTLGRFDTYIEGEMSEFGRVLIFKKRTN